MIYRMQRLIMSVKPLDKSNKKVTHKLQIYKSLQFTT